MIVDGSDFTFEAYQRGDYGPHVIVHGNCLEVMAKMPDKCVDLLLTDPPYGITNNTWDVAIDIDLLWSKIQQVSPVFICTASQPFASTLICHNRKHFKHEWIWQKNRAGNFLNTVREPMKEHEHVLVFATSQWTYNPQMQMRAASGLDRSRYKFCPMAPVKAQSDNYGAYKGIARERLPEKRVPSSVQRFNVETGLHPTQKPVKLFVYMLQTYSNPGDLILDPFLGSGTTLVAARQLGRRAIGIEIEYKYCEIAQERLKQEVLGL